MKKIICIAAALFLGGEVSVWAQSEIDAYRFSQREESGSARYLSMGGAFGALGGDISAMSTNPGGLGIYRSSEVVTGVSLSFMHTNTNWAGTELNANKTRFNFDNIAYVGYFPTGSDEGVKSWNVGFSYNRVKNFNRSYRMSRSGGYSIADYIAAQTNRIGVTGNNLLWTDDHNPYMTQSWLAALGYNAGLIETYSPGAGNTFFNPFCDSNGTPWDVQDATLQVSEKGAIDVYDIAFATNISDRLFLGLTVAITDLDYSMSTLYDENFGRAEGALEDDRLYFDNYETVNGTGYSFNIGAILRPVDFLRVGIAYNSPTWYKMTDYIYAEAGAFIPGRIPNGSNEPGYYFEDATPENQYYNYKLRTPGRWIFSAAGIFGQSALLSVDYEISNYGQMRLYDGAGYENEEQNGYIREDFGMMTTLRIGAEVKVTPRFAVRAGGAWQKSPVKATLEDGTVEVATAGTRTAYTIDQGAASYSIGLGYRFTPHFYMDLACIYKTYKEDARPFSPLFGMRDYSDIVDENGNIPCDPASLKTHNTRIALTLGYKF